MIELPIRPMPEPPTSPELQAEIARLRKALQDIAACAGSPGQVYRIGVRALEAKE